MREQPTRVRTGAGKTIMAFILAAMAILALALGVWYTVPPSYSPPPFEAAAVAGLPSPPKNMLYGEISAKGGYGFGIAGNIYQQQDGSLLLYFTNPADSGINLMCEIKNVAAGETLYRSGVLRPGEYVERLAPLFAFPNEKMEIEMNVYAFEPDTWYSMGTISLANVLQPF